MTRHARNCTAGAVYTYHEKQKDSRASGYGSQDIRLGKDSVKDFDCCCLTLQPCREPLISPEGYLYDKESILEFIIHQKREIAKKEKEYDKQLKKEKNELAEIAAAEQRSKLEKFINTEKNLTSKQSASSFLDKPGTSKSSVSNMIAGKDKSLPSFWIPALTPDSKEVKIKKPEKTIYCPMSGKALKFKDLMPIKFTPVVDPDEKKSLIARKNRYMCAVTHDILSNTTPCAVLKTSGSVVTVECLEKIIKPDMIDPTNNKTITERDIIYMQMGGTGYSSTNENISGKDTRPVLHA